MKTKRELWLEVAGGKNVAELVKFFDTKDWKSVFGKLLHAPWRGDSTSAADAEERLRRRVQHHLLNGKATASDALLTAIQEDPQLYEAARGNGSSSSTRSSNGSTKKAAKKKATKKKARSRKN